MLFVRSPDGVSHHPSEHADEADCLLACEVLAEVLRRRCQVPRVPAAKIRPRMWCQSSAEGGAWHHQGRI